MNGSKYPGRSSGCSLGSESSTRGAIGLADSSMAISMRPGALYVVQKCRRACRIRIGSVTATMSITARSGENPAPARDGSTHWRSFDVLGQRNTLDLHIKTAAVCQGDDSQANRRGALTHPFAKADFASTMECFGVSIPSLMHRSDHSIL